MRNCVCIWALSYATLHIASPAMIIDRPCCDAIHHVTTTNKPKTKTSELPFFILFWRSRGKGGRGGLLTRHRPSRTVPAVNWILAARLLKLKPKPAAISSSHTHTHNPDPQIGLESGVRNVALVCMLRFLWLWLWLWLCYGSGSGGGFFEIITKMTAQ